MGRRIWIVPKDTEITDEVKEEAELNGCSEIALGIPPILEGKVGVLPCVYEEPDPLPTIEIPPKSTHIATLVSINVANPRPANVKRVWEGRDYFYDCFVTETVKDQYLAGDIVVGDYLLVHFDPIGGQIVTAKVFKSW